MVDTIVPDGKWVVIIETGNSNCPHLVFPTNYHGCNYGSGDIPKCNFETCPLRVRPAVISELIKTVNILSDQSDLSCIVNSFDDTLTDEEVFGQLQEWNNANSR